MPEILHINNFNKKYKELIIFIILSWIALWFSIDTNPNFSQIKNFNLISLLNNTRVLIAFASIFISTILILYVILKKEIKIYNKTNSILFLFFFYFILQIIGLKKNSELEFNLENLYIILLAIGSLNIFLILNFLKLTKILKYILYLTIIMLAVFLIIIILTKINSLSLFPHSDSFNLYSFIHPGEKFLNREYPRITGISRMLAIVNLVLIIFLEFNSKLKSILLLILASFFSSIIWGMQSRGTIICFFFSLLVICFYLKNINFKRGLSLIFILFFLPVIIFEYSRPILFKKNYERIINLKLENEKKQNHEEIIHEEIIKEIKIRIFETKNTSGRIDLWKGLIDKYDKNKLFGYGPQADRLLLGKEYDRTYAYGNNVSNGLIYAFACGGYLAALIIIIIYYRIFTYISYIFLKKKFLKKMPSVAKISIILLIFLSIRSLVENSFALFSVDFLLFLISITIIENFIKKNKI
jgi:hypothetical protein